MTIKKLILRIVDRFSNLNRIQELDKNLTLIAEQNMNFQRRIDLLESSSLPQATVNSDQEYLLTQLSVIHTEYGNRLRLLNRSIWKMVRDIHYPGHDFDIAALNGQFSKQLIFKGLLSKYQFDQIIETGTYFGYSTKYFAKQGLPIITVESVQNHLDIAQVTCAGLDNIEFIKGSSNDVLDQMVTKKFAEKFNLYYLDAHWEEHIPLYQEIDIIAARNPESVMMIDDFKVPTDEEYAYDSYGDTNLDLIYISDLIDKYDLKLYFPTIAAVHDYCTIDIIAPRGTLVITASSKVAEKLDSIDVLKRYHA